MDAPYRCAVETTFSIGMMGAYSEGGIMHYRGKHIRIGIVDNDALVLGALQYVMRTCLPQSEVIWRETDGNRRAKATAIWPHSDSPAPPIPISPLSALAFPSACAG